MGKFGIGILREMLSPSQIASMERAAVAQAEEAALKARKAKAILEDEAIKNNKRIFEENRIGAIEERAKAFDEMSPAAKSAEVLLGVPEAGFPSIITKNVDDVLPKNSSTDIILGKRLPDIETTRSTPKLLTNEPYLSPSVPKTTEELMNNASHIGEGADDFIAKGNKYLDLIGRNKGKVAAASALTGAGLIDYLKGNGGAVPPNSTDGRQPYSESPSSTPLNNGQPTEKEEKPSEEGSNKEPEKSALEKELLRQLSTSNRKLMPSEIDFGENSIQSLDNLRDAQEKSNLNRLIANLGSASSQIGAGVAGLGANTVIKPDTSGFENLLKSSDTPVEQYKSQREQEKYDPNSPQSKGMRDLLRNQFGINVKGQASFADMEKLYPQFVNMYNAEEARKARKEMLQLSLAQRKDSAIEANTNKAKTQVSALDEKFIKNVNALDQKEKEAMTQIDNAVALAAEAVKNPTAAVNLARGVIKAVEGPAARVSDKDVVTALRAGGLPEQSIALLQQMESGTITRSQEKDVKALMQQMQIYAQKRYQGIKDGLVYRHHKLSNRPIEEVSELGFIPGTYKYQGAERKQETKQPVKSNAQVDKEHKDAQEWAKANPDDPRAKLILQLNNR